MRSLGVFFILAILAVDCLSIISLSENEKSVNSSEANSLFNHGGTLPISVNLTANNKDPLNNSLGRRVFVYTSIPKEIYDHYAFNATLVGYSDDEIELANIYGNYNPYDTIVIPKRVIYYIYTPYLS